MRFQIPMLCGLVLCCVQGVQVVAAPLAQKRAETVLKEARSGCVVWARAYVDPAYSERDGSRFWAEVQPGPNEPFKWGVTIGDRSGWDYVPAVEAISATPFGSKKRATLHATLHQFDIYEERVTFHDLDVVAPADTPGSTPNPRGGTRYIELKQAVSATTVSGIRVTLPAQGAGTLRKLFMGSFNGNMNAVFLQIKTEPSRPLATLPLSPLFQKHHKPISIKLECPSPLFMVHYMADNTFSMIAIGMQNGQPIEHLDSLTLILRQRVELQSIPIALQIPVERR